MQKRILSLLPFLLIVWVGVVYYYSYNSYIKLPAELFHNYDLGFWGLYVLLFLLIRFNKGKFLPAVLLLIGLVGYRYIVDIMVTLVLIITFIAVGNKLFSVFRLKSINFLDEIIFSFGLGVGLVSIILMVVGFLELYYTYLLWALVFVSIVWLRKNIYSLWTRVFEYSKNMSFQMNLWECSFLSLGCVFLIFVFIHALAPEIQYDSLMYHLSVPKIFIENHGIVQIPEEYRSYWPLNAQMIYLFGMILKGEVVAKLLSYSFFIILLMVIYAVVQKYNNGPEFNKLGPLIYLSTPVVGWLASTTYIDLIMSYYILLACYSFYLWYENSEKENALFLSGVLLGISQGIKLFTVFYFILFLLTGLFRNYKIKINIQVLFKFSIIYSLIGIPWYLRSFFLTGNPVYPFLNNFFGLETVFEAPEGYGSGTGFIDFLKLPWDVTVNMSNYDIYWGTGLLWLCLLIIIPLGYFFLEARNTKTLFYILALVTFGSTFFWFETSQSYRYFTPILTFIAVLMTLALTSLINFANASKILWFKHLLFMLLTLTLITNYFFLKQTYWNVPGRLPLDVVVGQINNAEYLKKAEPSSVVYQYLNDNYNIGNGKRAKLLSLNNDFLYLSDVKMLYSRKSPVHKDLRTLKEHELLKELEALGITHIFVDYGRLLRKNVITQSSFIDKYLVPEFVYENRVLFKVYYGNKNKKTKKELLLNTGFEESTKNDELIGWTKFGTPEKNTTGKFANNGNYAIKATVENLVVQSVLIQQQKIYMLSHYSRTENGEAFGRLQINWLDKKGEVVGASIKVYKANNKHQNNSMFVQAPSNAYYASVYITTHSNRDEIWFDDISFSEVTMNSEEENERFRY